MHFGRESFPFQAPQLSDNQASSRLNRLKNPKIPYSRPFLGIPRDHPGQYCCKPSSYPPSQVAWHRLPFRYLQPTRPLHLHSPTAQIMLIYFCHRQTTELRTAANCIVLDKAEYKQKLLKIQVLQIKKQFPGITCSLKANLQLWRYVFSR